VQILTDFFTFDKKFPIVSVELSSRTSEDYLNAYYRYNLNNYFGAYPLNLKDSIEPIFFFIVNLSKTLTDFSISFDYIYEYYFTPKLTNLVIKKTREYFLPFLQQDPNKNNDPFIEYADLWNKLAVHLKVYYLEAAKEMSTTYFGFMKAKVNRLYVTTIESIKCREEDENLARNFLDKIRKKFYDSISTSSNSELRNLLLNMNFTSFIIQGLNTIESYETFYDIYNFAELNSSPVLYKLSELREEFNKATDIVLNSIYENIFSSSSIALQDISKVLDHNNEELGIELAKGLFNYIK